MYCLKCKENTADRNPKKVMSNNKNMLKANCSVCGGKKSKFIPKQKGGMYNAENKREFNVEEKHDKPKKEKYLG